MKRIERFLVAFAVLGVLVCLFNMREGLLLVTCALPVLAAFYLFGAYFLLKRASKEKIASTTGTTILSIVAGIGFAYCLLSLLSLFLRWIRVADFLENTLVITTILSLIGGIAFLRTRNVVYKNLLQRSLPMLGAFILIGIAGSYNFYRLRG